MQESTNNANQDSKIVVDTGLLSLVNTLKDAIDSKYDKKIEELEFKILEKHEIIEQLEMENSSLRLENERKDLELFRLSEEVNVSKKTLEELIAKLNN